MFLSCGDALIDFIPVTALDGRDAYVPAVGGSCCNIAIALGRLGARAGFMGGVSTDFFGDMLMDGMRQSNVSTEYVARLDLATTVGFVKLGVGEPQYVFYDDATACRMWTRSASKAPGPEVRLLHIGSVPLINLPVADELLALLEGEKGKRLLSVDPNCRPSITRHVEDYRARMIRILALADIIKLSVSDLEFLQPGAHYAEAAEEWLSAGSQLVVVTQGGDGATAFWHDGKISVAAKPVDVVDTIGAGDSFLAGLLVSLDESGRLSAEALKQPTRDELERALSFAAAVAAITCGRSGADPPWRREIP
jgi:fructokinase